MTAHTKLMGLLLLQFVVVHLDPTSTQSSTDAFERVEAGCNSRPQGFSRSSPETASTAEVMEELRQNDRKLLKLRHESCCPSASTSINLLDPQPRSHDDWLPGLLVCERSTSCGLVSPLCSPCRCCWVSPRPRICCPPEVFDRAAEPPRPGLCTSSC